MTIPSSTAGKACAECGMPDPCVLDVITDFPGNKERHIWSKEGCAHFTLLDKGNGCNGTVAITFKCAGSTTHRAWLEEASGIHDKNLKPGGNPNNVNLHYKGQNDDMDIISAFRSPWEYLGSITTPLDVFDEPAHYRVVIDSCYECGHYVEIDVYPTLEIRFTTGFSYDITSSRRTRTIKERRDERIKSREVMGNTLPKNRNKLRSGWKNTTAEFEWTNKTQLTVEFGLKVAGIEYTHKYEEEIKKLRQIKTLEQLDRIDSFIENINKYFSPDPENKNNTRKYALFSAAISPVQLGISYAYQYTDIKDGPCHFYGLYGKPFFEASFRFDIISFICAYCKIEPLVNRCREYLRKHGTSVECYIDISPAIDLDIGGIYAAKDKSWGFNIKESQISLGLKGAVSATFEAEVFVVELTAITIASIEAKTGFEFEKHDNGLDLVLFHDGVNGMFEFQADVSYHRSKSNNKNTGKLSHAKYDWQLCAPLEVKDSPLRVNLYGSIKPINKPTQTPSRTSVPWAMGSNPEWNKKH